MLLSQHSKRIERKGKRDLVTGSKNKKLGRRDRSALECMFPYITPSNIHERKKGLHISLRRKENEKKMKSNGDGGVYIGFLGCGSLGWMCVLGGKVGGEERKGREGKVVEEERKEGKAREEERRVISTYR